MKLKSRLFIPLVACSSLLCSSASFAFVHDTSHPYWYLGGNIGVSSVNDLPSSAANTVHQNGPGWNVLAGYQLTSIFGGELGYTQYDDSNENNLAGTTNVANTEHYTVNAAVTGQYPIVYNVGALAKIGLSHCKAEKVFVTSGARNDATDVSAYGGLGLTFKASPMASFVAQWARAWGNSSTGSTDLYSVGVLIPIS